MTIPAVLGIHRAASSPLSARTTVFSCTIFVVSLATRGCEGGRKRGKKGKGREEWREGGKGREEWREEGRRERGREGGREEQRKGGREEGGRERVKVQLYH